MPPGGWSRGLAESEARSVQETSERDHQSRFRARVELLRWDPQHEIDERRPVRPEDFLHTLSWGSAPTAAIIVAAGLKAERGRGLKS
jgi:hypothetical protein